MKKRLVLINQIMIFQKISKTKLMMKTVKIMILDLEKVEEEEEEEEDIIIMKKEIII